MADDEERPHSNLTPVFIGGTGRSGTTILEKIVASHHAVVSLPQGYELCLLTDPEGALDLAYALSSRWTPYHADTAIHRFLRKLHFASRGNPASRAISSGIRRAGAVPPPYSILRLDKWFGSRNVELATERLIQRIVQDRAPGRSWIGSVHWQRQALFFEAGPLSEAEAFTFVGSFFRELFQERAGKGTTHWVDDTPENMVRGVELLRMFPDAKIIHILRHPLDVVASYRRQSWSGSNVTTIANKVGSLLERWVANKRLIPDSQVLEVSLERMVEDPRNVIGHMCEFLGIALDEHMFSVRLEGANIGRWRAELAPADVAAARARLDEIIQTFGYHVE